MAQEAVGNTWCERKTFILNYLWRDRRYDIPRLCTDAYSVLLSANGRTCAAHAPLTCVAFRAQSQSSRRKKKKWCERWKKKELEKSFSSRLSVFPCDVQSLMKMYANIIFISNIAPAKVLQFAWQTQFLAFGGINSSISFIDKSRNAFDEGKKKRTKIIVNMFSLACASV